MKKLFFLITILLTFSLNAQTISGYFSHKAIGVVPAFNQKGYEYGNTALKKAGSASYYIASPALGWSASQPINYFMGDKVLLGVVIDTAFSNVVSTTTVEISGDNTNWTAFATLTSDNTPDVTGTYWYLVDFTSCFVPYVRIKFNANLQAIGTSGYLHFVYAVPQ